MQMKEKSLIKKGELNIFQKMTEFFRKIFFRNAKTENENIKQSNTKTNVIDELKAEKQILLLQQKYEAGKIKETQLSEKEEQDLISLYVKQIKTLEDNIAAYEKKLEFYDNEIKKKKQL